MIHKISTSQKSAFYLGDKRYFALCHQNSYFVVPDKCHHRGGPLSLGEADGERGIITCPMHGLKACMKVLVKSALPCVCVNDNLYVVLPD